MTIKSLTFRGFKWPYNPATFNMEYDTRVIKHEFPDVDGAETEDMGAAPVIFSGSGAFYGKYAYSHFKSLSAYALSNSVGILNHPKYGKYNVRLTKLVSREEALPNYVEYDFEFIQHKDIAIIPKSTKKPGSHPTTSNNSGASSTRYYIVKSGDNLSKISKKYYGTPNKWKVIADANKKLIKNPNLIRIGWKLIIPR